MDLPDVLSPCANVRRTCKLLMESDAEDRSVSIDSEALDALGTTIANIVQSQTQKSAESSNSNVQSLLTEESCVHNLEFAAWDEFQWHYNAENYSRTSLSEHVQHQRFERIALYILVMDTINFCFWPKSNVKNDGQDNLLEYEHLASALKILAEKDDVLDYDCGNMMIAEDSYAFAPQNLIKLTPETFLNMMMPLMPNDVDYIIPNVQERVRLLNEMGQALLTFHRGSATYFIAQSKRSADLMVYHILESFSGFRDTAIDRDGRIIAFYKRAQILVADLWAALGSENGEDKYGKNMCNFDDMEKITMFPDYRIPQLLRSMDILTYSQQLGDKVDNKIELEAFSMDELYIRAATVVAVDLLVENVQSKIAKDKDINAVKMDWYLWNLGEILDRQGKLSPHHRIRTIFY